MVYISPVEFSGLGSLEAPQFWGIIFFGCLIMLGIDSAFSLCECMITFLKVSRADRSSYSWLYDLNYFMFYLWSFLWSGYNLKSTWAFFVNNSIPYPITVAIESSFRKAPFRYSVYSKTLIISDPSSILSAIVHSYGFVNDSWVANSQYIFTKIHNIYLLKFAIYIY